MAIFLYTFIFILASPVMFLAMWWIIKYQRKKEARQEALDDGARLAKLAAANK